MAVLSLDRLSKRFGAAIGGRCRFLRGAGARGLRPARAERLRQEHHPEARHRLPLSDLGDRPGCRHRRRARRPRRPGAHRLRAGGFAALRAHARRRVPRLHGAAARDHRPRPRPRHRRRGRAAVARQRARRHHRAAVARLPAARVARAGRAAQAGAAGPRRAEQRPGPPADHRVARAAAAPGAGLRRAGDLPHPGRDRADRRPGGDPARRTAADRGADRPGNGGGAGTVALEALFLDLTQAKAMR